MKFDRAISASQIDRFLTCPLAYKYVYIDGAVRMPGNIYTSFGSAIHAALEYNFRQKITSRADLPIRDIVKYFEDEFVNECKGIGGYTTETFQLLQTQGASLIMKYMNEIGHSLQPLLVEHEFRIYLPSADVTIHGFIDLVTEDGRIIDYKTIGESSVTRWTQRYVDRMHQLTMYSLAYRKIYGTPESSVEIHTLKRLKSGCSVGIMKTTRQDVQVVSLVQLMARMKQIIENEMWYPNYASCDTCDFRNTCLKLSYF